MNGKAVVLVSDERIEMFLKGRLLVSYPRRLWEVSKEEGNQTLWFSRERTRNELDLLFLTLRQTIRRNGGLGMEVKVIENLEEQEEEEEVEWEDAA
jgi:hypothetical protein